jgi:C1A family cysteine protease
MAKESSSHVYGWKRQLPDHRDMVFKVQNESSVVLPNEVDLRQWCPPVMDQGQIGSCTAHGITALLRYDRIKNGLPDIPLSRLQLYYDERNLEGTVEVDAGAEIRDGIKVASSNGIAPETLWPYAVENFKVKPDVTVYTEAVSDKALTYQSVPVSTFGLKSALASGFPVVIGISIYQSFESQEVARTGIVPMPAGTE